MVYIRSKNINGKEYYYLQRCIRKNGCVKTEHLKYLGTTKPDLDKIKLEMPDRTTNKNNVMPKNKPLILDANSEYSFEKYDLSQAKIIGKGSDRIVAELPDGNVIKIAITPRGIVQNQSEGDYLAPVPEVKDKGIDYVVVEKISKTKEDDKKMRKILKEYEGFSQTDFDRKTSELQTQFAKTDEKYDTSFVDLQNYDLMFGDFQRVSSWGFKDRQPVLIDAGTLNNKIGKLNNQDAVFKEYNYTKDDWNNVLTKRKQTANTVLKKDTKINS